MPAVLIECDELAGVRGALVDAGSGSAAPDVALTTSRDSLSTKPRWASSTGPLGMWTLSFTFHIKMGYRALDVLETLSEPAVALPDDWFGGPKRHPVADRGRRSLREGSRPGTLLTALPSRYEAPRSVPAVATW